jgi:hypothetical protein
MRSMRNVTTADLLEHRKLPRAARRGPRVAARAPGHSARPWRSSCACGGGCPACQARNAAAEDEAPRHSPSEGDFRGAPEAPAPVPVGPPQPRSTGLGSTTPTFTLSGLSFSATATYSPCTDCVDGLEAIQVVWATGGVGHLGKHTTAFPPLAAVYHTFVDGGRNGPDGPGYAGSHPYYIGRDDLPASYGFLGAGCAGWVSGCTVSAKDVPTASTSWDEAYFETAFVCLNYQGKGKDKLLDSVKWGFASGKNRADPRVPGADIIVSSEPSSEFEATLKADYPDYSYE